MQEQAHITQEKIFELYGDYLLNHGEKPKNVYLFAKENNFEEKELTFEDGDKLLLFTDGIVEAKGLSGEYFGTERIKEIFTENKDSENVLETIQEELFSFVGGDKLEDDLTFLLIERG